MATAAVARENNVSKIGIFSCFGEKGRIPRVIRHLMPYSFSAHEGGWKQFPSARISLSLAKSFLPGRHEYIQVGKSLGL